MSGRLEIFFEGSWGQVCASDFNGVDANVACGQLGFGAGTVGPAQAQDPRGNLADRFTASAADQLVFPEVVLTLSGCTGSEATLLECDPEPLFPTYIYTPIGTAGCLNRDEPGLILSCVAEPEPGVRLSCFLSTAT